MAQQIDHSRHPVFGPGTRPLLPARSTAPVFFFGFGFLPPTESEVHCLHADCRHTREAPFGPLLYPQRLLDCCCCSGQPPSHRVLRTVKHRRSAESNTLGSGRRQISIRNNTMARCKTGIAVVSDHRIRGHLRLRRGWLPGSGTDNDGRPAKDLQQTDDKRRRGGLDFRILLRAWQLAG